MTQVKKQRSADSWTAEFERAYAEGRFLDAALVFEQNGKSEPIRLLLLAARANIHSDPSVTLHLLLNASFPASKRREQVERDLLLAEAFARTDDFESADEKLAAALANAKRLQDRELLSAVGYRYIRRHLLAEDPASARQFLDLARKGQSRTSRIYALYAETLILPFEERIAEQADHLIELLRSLDPAATEFHELRAWSTEALAILARELYLPEAIVEVDRQISGIPWPRDFARNLFQALKALGWAKAIQGDYFNGFRHLKHAATVADTAAWRVVAACDQAYLARRLGEHRWSRVELDEAEQLLRTVDWHTTQSEERAGLLLLAELFSTIDAGRSAMYLARYRELGEIKSPLHYRRDARIAAFAQYSTGIVEIALGNGKRGITELREARAVFERFGYDFRVALCLVAESAATGNGSLLQLAHERLHNYGQSWLATELRGIGGRSDIALPRMQQRVFDEVCKGKTTAEIAKILDRSEFTVSNHIKEIFKTFNVNNRASLLAEAARRGILKQGSSTDRPANALSRRRRHDD